MEKTEIKVMQLTGERKRGLQYKKKKTVKRKNAKRENKNRKNEYKMQLKRLAINIQMIMKL